MTAGWITCVIPDGSDLDVGAVPWAMQVVVRVERDPAPQHTDVLRATASAVARQTFESPCPPRDGR